MTQVENFDALVLGSGPGGNLLAWHLARSGQRVVVVVRGSMTSPDVRATSRAYVAGLERHKMEAWRTNAASGPRLGASSMTNRLYSSLDERRGSGQSQLHCQVSLPAYFLAGRGIGVTPTCSSAVYGAP